jgi:NitT/TauT family transport system permease protein
VIVGFLLEPAQPSSAICSASPTAELRFRLAILAQIAPKVAFAPLFILWMGFTIYPRSWCHTDRVLPVW